MSEEEFVDENNAMDEEDEEEERWQREGAALLKEDDEEEEEEEEESDEEDNNNDAAEEGHDLDVHRNLELLQQLGMLGPGNKKHSKGAAAKKHKRRASAALPARASSRLKGEDPQVDFGRPLPPQPIIHMHAERGAEPTSYRNVITGVLETYTARQRERLAPAGAFKPFVAPAAPLSLDPRFPPCAHCRLRQDTQLSACASCAAPHGAICGQCLWRRYGENVTQLSADWQCPNCRGICNCSTCRRDKGWGAVGEGTAEEVAAGGHVSVAHMLVALRFGVDSTVDINPNPVRKRGRPLGGGGEWLRRLRRVQKSTSFARLPIVLAGGVVLSLGKVVWDRPGFHSPDYIYPPGYRVQRVQHCDGGGYFIMELAVVDGGDKPIFRAHATDRPEQVFEGLVSSTPISELLTVRRGRQRTLSGPRMLFLDDVMVRAALHAQSFDYIHRNPAAMAAYRHLAGDAFALPAGAFVCVRALPPATFHVARVLHDAVVLRRDPSTVAVSVEWCECIDAALGHYVLPVGEDDIPCHAIFFHFTREQFAPLPGNANVWAISSNVPDLVGLVTDTRDYDLFHWF